MFSWLSQGVRGYTGPPQNNSTHSHLESTIVNFDDKGRRIFINLDEVMFNPDRKHPVNDKGEEIYFDVRSLEFNPIRKNFV